VDADLVDGIVASALPLVLLTPRIPGSVSETA